MAADPADSRHLFLGTATGWVYDSHDVGKTWTRVAQIANRNDLVVEHILVDEHNPKRLVVGGWFVDHPDQGGIFISEDYGKDWYSQAEMRGQSIRALARGVSDPNELVAGTLRGVFRSMDNGVHWTQISPEGSTEIHEVESVAIDPADPNVIYAGTWHLPWKTTDGGVTWHNIKQGIIDDSDVFSIIVDPKQPQTVYASACSGIYKSADGGDLFHKVQGIPSTARRTRKLAQDPEHLDTVFAGTTEGLYRTLDGGTQWQRLTPSNVIVNDVYVDPSDSDHVLIATDRGGVYRSDDGGSTFQPSNDGFSARQVTAYAADPASPDTLYVGVVNDKTTGGVFESTDGGVRWTQQSKGLGGRDVFSLVSLADGTLLAGTEHGIYRLAGGGDWQDSSLLLATGAAEAVVRHPETRPLHAAAQRSVAVRPDSRTRARLKRVSGERSSLSTLPAGQSRPKGGRGKHGRPKHGVAKGGVAKHGRGKPSPPRRHGVSDSRVRSARSLRQGTAPEHRGRFVLAREDLRQHTGSADAHEGEGAKPLTKSTTPGRLDTVVYSLMRSPNALFAGTASGLLRSDDSGGHWVPVKELALPDVRFLALAPPDGDAAKAATAPLMVAGDLAGAALSGDGGATWTALSLPTGLQQIGAVGVDGENNLWVGGREGVWYSSDSGATWKSLRNLFLTEVDSIFYDAVGKRILVTSAVSPMAFSVAMPDMKVSYADTGWKLRFVRPVGGHLVGATLFDGVVVQPQMVDTPTTPTAAALK